jgi:hypothetical protein
LTNQISGNEIKKKKFNYIKESKIKKKVAIKIIAHMRRCDNHPFGLGFGWGKNK